MGLGPKVHYILDHGKKMSIVFSLTLVAFVLVSV